MQKVQFEAALTGKTTFEGSACKRCGSTKRGTLNGSCIACSNEVSKRCMAEKRAQLKQLMDAAKASK